MTNFSSMVHLTTNKGYIFVKFSWPILVKFICTTIESSFLYIYTSEEKFNIWQLTKYIGFMFNGVLPCIVINDVLCTLTHHMACNCFNSSFLSSCLIYNFNSFCSNCRTSFSNHKICKVKYLKFKSSCNDIMYIVRKKYDLYVTLCI